MNRLHAVELLTVYPFRTLFCLLLSTLLLSACGSSGDGSTSTAIAHYYIDATGGSDENSGLSESAAWQSLSRIGQASFSGPVTISLKSGETRYESLLLTASGITLNRYGNGALPVLDDSIAATGWLADGSGHYYLDIPLSAGEALGNISENGAMMTFLPWQGDAATSFSGATSGSYSYDWNLNRLFILPAQNPSLNSYRISRLITGISAEDLSDIHISEIAIRRFSLHGIQFNRCTRCDVSGVSVSQVGGAVIDTSPSTRYAGNGIEYANASSSGVTEDVTITDVFDSCLTAQTFENAQTADAVGHGERSEGR